MDAPVGRGFTRLACPSLRADWLDVGCGTGAVAEIVLRKAAPRRVVGIDASDGLVACARASNGEPRASFQLGDAQCLPFDAGTFEVAVSGLMLNYVPEPRKAVAEMARVVRTGGTVAVYLWDYMLPMHPRAPFHA